MIERIAATFRGSLYALLTLSVLAIGFSEGEFFPHFLTLPLIAVAYFYLDQHPILRTESLATSVLGVLALMVSILEFQQGRIDVEMRILSASHLLAYFAWITLLLQKEHQQYWWLLALSVLNMAVSASLTSSALLGLAVVAYLFTAVWTLALFTAFRGTSSLRTASGHPAATPGKAETSGTPPQTSPEAATAASQASLSAAPPGDVQAAVSHVRGGFHFDPADNWLGLRLIGSVLFLSFASLGVGMAIFTMTPRIWIGNWQLPSSSEEAIAGINFGNKVSGFTSEVSLGDMGKILDNPTPVMYINFSDSASGNPITLDQVLLRYRQESLLFRGTTLSRYETGNWSEDDSVLSRDIPSADAPRQNQAIRFRYELEPVGRSTLFAVYPIEYGILLKDEEVFRKLSQNSLSQEISISSPREYGGMSTIRYEMVSVPNPIPGGRPYSEIAVTDDKIWEKLLQTISAAIEEEFQAGSTRFRRSETDFSEFIFRERTKVLVRGYDNYFRNLLDYDRSSLTRLTELARKVCSDAEGNLLSPEERCVKLQQYLKNSGEFGYTLDMNRTDPAIDPVEDFLFNRKAGHCEYFASAMTLMLRSVGVPSRLVSGFKGGRWEERKGRLVVEQRHAHAWVEAFVDGRWLVFDPTTFGDAEEESQLTRMGLSLATLRGYLNNFWQNNVIGVSLSRQRNDIYDPIRNRLLAVQAWGKDFIDSFSEQSDKDTRPRSMQRFALRLMLVVIVILIVVTLLYYFRFRWELLWPGWNPFSRRRPSGQRQMLLFFRRFIDIAARNGLRKRPDQTAREFAAQFEARFRSQLAVLSLENLPMTLATAYYQVRFRGDDLSSADLEHWKIQLDSLGHALEKVR